MKNIVFQYRKNTNNVGDQNCCPGLWFDFGHGQFQDLGETAPQCDLAIFGGGQVAHQCLDGALYHSLGAKKHVLWGVGMTQKFAHSFKFDILKGVFHKASSRDPNINGLDHVPCPSAMSALFDNPPAPQHEIVMFLHAEKPAISDCPSSIMQMTNHGCSFEQAISFLASGETVISNSYHGVYWAMCLGRRVLCLPFSDKFNGFLTPPVMSDPQQWRRNINKAEPRLEILDHARTQNRWFYNEVMNLLA